MCKRNWENTKSSFFRSILCLNFLDASFSFLGHGLCVGHFAFPGISFFKTHCLVRVIVSMACFLPGPFFSMGTLSLGKLCIRQLLNLCIQLLYFWDTLVWPPWYVVSQDRLYRGRLYPGYIVSGEKCLWGIFSQWTNVSVADDLQRLMFRTF